MWRTHTTDNVGCDPQCGFFLVLIQFLIMQCNVTGFVKYIEYVTNLTQTQATTEFNLYDMTKMKNKSKPETQLCGHCPQSVYNIQDICKFWQ